MRRNNHAHPTSSPWPPETGTIDRDLDIAISQFAPGSETVKDDKVYTAVGLVRFQPSTQWRADTRSGLGPERDIGLCRHCKAMVTEFEGVEGCPVCGNQQDFSPIIATEPLGFCTDFFARDYDGQIEWGSQSTHARVASDERNLTTIDVKNVRLWTSEADKAELISINDNNGRLFEFEAEQNGKYIVRDAIPDSSRANFAYEGEPRPLALMSAKVSDLLLLEFKDFPAGAHLSPSGSSRREDNGIYARAGLYSFGFLMRRAASVMLDIDEREISVGIRPIRRGSDVLGQVFLCDTLENGAGYCRSLSEAGNFQKLIDFALSDSFIGKLAIGNHKTDCQTACYDCMLDYGNMSYHGLLDWRLGTDLVRLARDRDYVFSVSNSLWSEVNGRAIGSFHAGLPEEQQWEIRAWGDSGVPGLFSADSASSVIGCHPLWRTGDYSGEELAEAVAEVEGLGKLIVYANVFDLLRRPAKVLSVL